MYNVCGESPVLDMVPILDGNSEIAAHDRGKQSLLFDLFKAFD